MVGHIVHKFQFFINMRIGQFRAESMTLYSCLKSCKKYDLIIFACAISCKKYLFRINAQFLANLVSYWYEIDAKFHAKKSFHAKTRNTQKNLLFRETPYRPCKEHWKSNSCKKNVSTEYRSVLLEIFHQWHTSKKRISLKIFSLNLQKMKLELIFSWIRD